MSATTITAHHTVARTGSRRAVLGVLAAAGPLAVAVAQLVLPYSAGAGNTEVATAAAAHPDAMSAVLWLDLAIALTLPVAAVVVGAAAVRAAPGWGVPAAVLTVAGFSAAALSALVPDLLAAAAGGAGSSPASVSQLLDALGAYPSTQVGLVAFLVGQVIGVILLGIAFWRGHTAPVWAALVLIVSGPLHVVFAAVVPNALLAAASWALTAVGFAAAVTTIRQEDR